MDENRNKRTQTTWLLLLSPSVDGEKLVYSLFVVDVLPCRRKTVV